MLLKYMYWILALGTLQLTNSAYLRCYRGSLNDYDEAPLESAETLLLSSCYNSKLNNSMYTFGFRGKVDGPATTAVLNALFRFSRNVFLLNWEQEASSFEFLGNRERQISYVTRALPNTITVGRSLGQTLVRMSDNGFNLSRTYLLAHSLGAHVFGNAGRYLVSVGKSLDRITGLDPARAFFEQPSFLTPLGSDCASFVDTIHTDPGSYAVNSSYATVDIYVNYGDFITGTKAEQVQPGCPVGDFEMFTEEDLCSHNRVWMLIIEAWSSNHTLKASKASNYNMWEIGVEGSPEVINMGDDINREASGNFYMSTNAQSPYGKGADGLYP